MSSAIGQTLKFCQIWYGQIPQLRLSTVKDSPLKHSLKLVQFDQSKLGYCAPQQTSCTLMHELTRLTNLPTISKLTSCPNALIKLPVMKRLGLKAYFCLAELALWQYQIDKPKLLNFITTQFNHCFSN